MAPGTQIFTYFNMGKETVRGTPVAPTRQMYTTGTSMLTPDFGLNFHEGENAGVRTTIRRATAQNTDFAWKMSTVSGVSFDDLVIPCVSQMKGAQTGAGGAADKTWTPTGIGAGGTMAQEAFSIDIGDETQNYRLQYAMATSWKLSAALGEVTQLEMEGFAQNAVKTAKASPAINSAPKIPGELWTIKYAATAAGLAGASINLLHLVDWELVMQTGLVWRHYMDGALTGAQHVETAVQAELSMTVESTSLAVSEFYDKALAQTLDFVRLKATSGVVLGGSFYSAQLDLPILWNEPEPISGEDNGVNMYKVKGQMAYDPTSAASFQPVLVNSLAAIP